MLIFSSCRKPQVYSPSKIIEDPKQSDAIAMIFTDHMKDDYILVSAWRPLQAVYKEGGLFIEPVANTQPFPKLKILYFENIYNLHPKRIHYMMNEEDWAWRDEYDRKISN